MKLPKIKIQIEGDIEGWRDWLESQDTNTLVTIWYLLSTQADRLAEIIHKRIEHNPTLEDVLDVVEDVETKRTIWDKS